MTTHQLEEQNPAGFIAARVSQCKGLLCQVLEAQGHSDCVGWVVIEWAHEQQHTNQDVVAECLLLRVLKMEEGGVGQEHERGGPDLRGNFQENLGTFSTAENVGFSKCEGSPVCVTFPSMPALRTGTVKKRAVFQMLNKFTVHPYRGWQVAQRCVQHPEPGRQQGGVQLSITLHTPVRRTASGRECISIYIYLYLSISIYSYLYLSESIYITYIHSLIPQPSCIPRHVQLGVSGI